MKKEIFIATPVDFSNYGNRLQNFAVHRTCERLGLTPVTLTVDNKKYFGLFRKRSVLKLLSAIHFDKFVANRSRFNSVLKSIYSWRFSQHWISTKYVPQNFDPTNIVKDAFVGIGGDQIWSQYWHKKIPFCNFVGFNPKHKLCFAPSFGTDVLDETYKDIVKEEIKTISFPAVRERSGAEIISALTNQQSKVISDPVLNLSKEEWFSFLDNECCKLPDKKYIFAYFLGRVSDNKILWIKEQIKENDLIIIDVNGKITGKSDVMSPLGFVKMLANSEYVLTDSYHAVLFALLLERNLVLFAREGGEKMNTRITYLVDNYYLKDTWFASDKRIDQFIYDFSVVSRKINEARIDALNFYKMIIDESSDNTSYEAACYKAHTKNDQIKFLSSSGGIFYQLGSEILNENGYVVGAQISTEGVVSLDISENEQQLRRCLGSKYVQADAGMIYRNVEALLRKGYKVLFSGTPCQCNALRRYLNKEYDNLYIVDLICHGVPSPGVWNKYLTHLNNKKISSINFRDKRNGWNDFGLSIKYVDGTEIYNSKNNDVYLQLFLHNIILRKSCYKCKNKGLNRFSDITLGDFWGCTESDSGISACIVNTKKGSALLNSVINEIELERTNFDKILKRNINYSRSVGYPFSRNRFFKDYYKNRPVFSALDKYNRSTYFEKLIRFILRKLMNKNIIRDKLGDITYISVLKKGSDTEKYKFNCSGCSACANICPKNAISMEPDEEGFLYPVIHLESCVSCGKCEKVCYNPHLNEKCKP